MDFTLYTTRDIMAQMTILDIPRTPKELLTVLCVESALLKPQTLCQAYTPLEMARRIGVPPHHTATGCLRM